MSRVEWHTWLVFGLIAALIILVSVQGVALGHYAWQLSTWEATLKRSNENAEFWREQYQEQSEHLDKVRRDILKTMDDVNATIFNLQSDVGYVRDKLKDQVERNDARFEWCRDEILKWNRIVKDRSR